MRHIAMECRCSAPALRKPRVHLKRGAKSHPPPVRRNATVGSHWPAVIVKRFFCSEPTLQTVQDRLSLDVAAA